MIVKKILQVEEKLYQNKGKLYQKYDPGPFK